MKTAISIPDSLFAEAERAAASMGVSRSQLYARALKRLLESRRDEEITRRLDEVYDETRGELDDGIAKIQFASIPREEW